MNALFVVIDFLLVMIGVVCVIIVNIKANRLCIIAMFVEMILI